MRNIAKEVGIRESAIYNHYSSKDELINTIFQEIQSVVDTSYLIDDNLLDELNNPQKFLQSFSEILLKHWASNTQRMAFRIILLEQYNEHKDLISVKKLIEEIKQVWIMIFNEMMNYKLVKKQDADIVANEFIAPLFFVRLKHLSSISNPNLSEAINETTLHINYFWNSIKK
jgi:AcrR family transcriptional regulator